jgi:hypothetical protein
MSRRAHIVTTRTGLHIGSAYIGKPPEPSADAEQIQAALLDERQQLAQRIAGPLERLGPVLFGAICVVALVAAAGRALWSAS